MYKVCTTLYDKKKLVSIDSLITRRSAYCLAIREGKILLVLTKNTTRYWFPGGVVEPGETKEEAVVRETYEESGLTVVVKKELLEVESYFYYDPAGEAYRQLSYFYLCEVHGTMTPEDNNPDEIDETTLPQWQMISDLRVNEFQDYGWEVLEFARSFSKP